MQRLCCVDVKYFSRHSFRWDFAPLRRGINDIRMAFFRPPSARSVRIAEESPDLNRKKNKIHRRFAGIFPLDQFVSEERDTKRIGLKPERNGDRLPPVNRRQSISGTG